MRLDEGREPLHINTCTVCNASIMVRHIRVTHYSHDIMASRSRREHQDKTVACLLKQDLLIMRSNAYNINSTINKLLHEHIIYKFTPRDSNLEKNDEQGQKNFLVH